MVVVGLDNSIHLLYLGFLDVEHAEPWSIMLEAEDEPTALIGLHKIINLSAERLLNAQ
jgi:hypothetical protein